MKKQTIYILSVFMLIALIGIIGVQWYWINNSVKVKEQQFDHLVITALNEVVSSLENEESVVFLTNQITATNEKTDTIKKQKVVWSQNSENNDSLKIIQFSSDNTEDISINVESFLADTKKGKDKVITTKKVMVNNNVVTEDVTTENFVGKRFDDIMVKLVKEFKHRDNPIEHLLKNASLDSLLKNKLKENNVFSNFTYAVINNDSIMLNYSHPNFLQQASNYSVPLFKYNLKEKNTVLALNFENKTVWLIQSMWVMITISVLFTLIILCSFIGALYIMFKQKKIANIKNDFINNMTHEFKTPLSTISLAIDSVVHPEVIKNEEKINYYADVIRAENKRMNTQVESLLNTSLAEKEELELNKQPIKIKALINCLETRFKLKLKKVNGCLSVKTTIINKELVGDEIHLQNALANIIDNSIKYCDLSPKIELNITKEENFIVFKITDNGIGMSNDQQRKVFDKFYRAQSGNIHKTKGFGIGLSYVKAIVEAHHGKVFLTSKPNKGSIFTIKIPQQ